MLSIIEPKQVKVDCELWGAARNRVEVHDDWGAEFKIGAGEGGLVTLHPNAQANAPQFYPEAVAEIGEAFKQFVDSGSMQATIGFLNRNNIDYSGEVSEREWSDFEIFQFWLKHKEEIEG